MKAIFISFDQAHRDSVMEALSRSLQRGYTLFPDTWGKGSKTGEPHLGSHAWPSMNSSILTICEDERVAQILKRLREIDEESPMLGLRAFVLPVEDSL
ncbi:MAG: hypothetical protein HUJ97_07440 [Bacteroidales bacterium]|nr:hypothetical protein [Bacteroidales bacterium]